VHAAPIEASANPYTSGAAAAAAETDGAQAPRERVGRSFRFNQKGKYTTIGDQMRADAKLEALKQRIAENARKAGLDTEFDTVEKNIKVNRLILRL
jgi:U4/U6 small nuclear ribonucleoprotein PRP3